MPDPDWLVKMRSEGRIIKEQWANPPAALPAPLAEVRVAEEKPARTPRPRPQANETPGPTALTIEVTIPIRLVSESNTGGSLRGKLNRKSRVKDAVRTALPQIAGGFPLPATVVITRLGQREMDSDNAVIAAKAVRDVVAEWLGVDDRDKRVRWVVRQKPAWTPGVTIRIAFAGV